MRATRSVRSWLPLFSWQNSTYVRYFRPSSHTRCTYYDLSADVEWICRNRLLARDLARWRVWHSGAYSPDGLKLRAWGRAYGPPPAPMPKSRASPGSDARHRSSDVILGFAKYASSFPYIFAYLSLSLLFRQSLLYDSQFNISIRTRLISTQIAAVIIGSPGGLLERKESTKLSSYPAPAIWVWK